MAPETLRPIPCLVALRDHFPFKVTVSANGHPPKEENVWVAAREWCHEQYGACFNDHGVDDTRNRAQFTIDRSARWGAYGSLFFFEDDLSATMFRVTWG